MLTFIVGHVHGTIVLLALASGYIVCHLAKKEKGNLKTIGYIIGVGIIVTSTVLLLGKALWIAKKCTKVGCMKPLSMPMSTTKPVLPKK